MALNLISADSHKPTPAPIDITTAEGQFLALASGTLIDITSSFSTTTSKLTLTFTNANQMTDYTEGESVWVGRFEASSSSESVTLQSNSLYVVDSVNTQTLQMILSIPSGQEGTFTAPSPTPDEIEGDVTIKLSKWIRNELGLIILDSIGSGSPSTYFSKSNS